MNPHIRTLSAVWEQISSVPRSRARQFVLSLATSARRDAPLIAIILVYWLCGLIVADLAHVPPEATITKYIGVYIRISVVMVILLIIGRGAQIMIRDRPARPMTQLIREIRTSLATPQRIAHAVPIVAGLLVFGGTFAKIKIAIPSFAQFTWDVDFERWDRWLHGGVVPWKLLQPLLGSSSITDIVDWLYFFWFYVFSFIWMWQAFSQRNPRLRMQFFLTLLLGGILLGSVAATLFASAGPCYFGKITGLVDPFLPLMQYLTGASQTHHLWALGTQEMLWQGYLMRHEVVGAGISAMPSMHVAYATLFALVCWRVRRLLGIAMAIYAVAILVGSVHLGWHYAIDGYVGALGMMAVWWVVGRLLNRQEQSSSPRPTTQSV